MRSKEHRIRNKSSMRGQESHRYGFRGRELRIPPQPTEFTSRPWWPLVVRILNPGTSVGLQQLVSSLRSQLGFASDVPVNVKLISVRVWASLGATLGQLSVSVFDPIAENIQASGATTFASRILEQYTRFPDQVNRACIGYEYSLAHQSLSLGTTTTLPAADVQLLGITGTGASSVAYYYVLWRSGNPTPSALTVVPEDDVDSDSEIEVVDHRIKRRSLKPRT